MQLLMLNAAETLEQTERIMQNVCEPGKTEDFLTTTVFPPNQSVL